MNRTVLLQTSGFAVSASRICDVYSAPYAVGFQIVNGAHGVRAHLQRRTLRRVDDVREILQHIGAVVAVQRIGAGQPLLIDLPRDTGCFETFRIGRPREQLILRRTVAIDVIVIVQQRATLRAGRIDHASHEICTVRMRRAGQRTEVGVADGEGIGERVVKRNVAAQVITHRHVRLVRGPLVITAVIDRVVRRVPRVVEIADALGAGRERVQMKRQHRFRRIFLRGLEPDRLAVGQRDWEAVVISAHAAHMTHVVIERTVLLHEHNNVFDVVDRSGAP
jgi:hypothetical protein